MRPLNTMASTPDNLDLFPAMQADGLVLLRNFFDPTLVRRANHEVEAFLRLDLEERNRAGTDLGRFEGSAGKTILDKAKHLILDFFAKSPALDQLAEQLLTDPRVASLVERTVGKNMKLRGYNIRHMTGAADNSAMEWHRDNPGEFNFAIVLNETAPTGDAATCYLPGSHLYPYCPFKEIHLGSPYAYYNPRMGFFASRLADKVTRNARAAYGGPGDAYLFVGDIWHGRQPNLRGRTGTVLFFAVFPSEMPFPSHSTVEIPPREVMDKLPPALRKIVQHDQVPPNPDRSAYLYVMEQKRKMAYPLSYWHLAKLERSSPALEKAFGKVLPKVVTLKLLAKGAFRRAKSLLVQS